MITRRQFTTQALAGVGWPALAGRLASASPVGGVRLGVQTYSFRELTKPGTPEAVDVMISSMKTCGVDECELWSPQIELAPPAGRDAPAYAQTRAREAMRAWRTSTGAAYYAGVRKRFGADLLYTRVDVLPSPEGPVVIELELTEPSLFLLYDDTAAQRLAAAVSRRL